MDLFVDKIFSLLAIPPGNFAYHLVVVFAIAAALQTAARFWSRADLPFGRRLVGGLLVLLGFQFVSFFAAAVAWLGVVDAHVLLPPLDRLLYLFSSLLIVWLWLFPVSRRSGDIALLLLALFVVTGFALSLVWWGGQQTATTFNGTWPDQATHIFGILLYIGALAALILSRPAGWGVGVAVLFSLFLGHILGLLLDPYEQDYSGGVRLAQMAAYPWLIYLSFRLSSTSEKPTTQPIAAADARRATVNPNLLHEFIELSTLEDPDKFYKILPQVVGRIMGADICLLVTAPEPNGQMSFPFGYNLLEEKQVAGFVIDSRLTPEITHSMLHSRTLRLPAASSAVDITVIARSLRVQNQGSLMAAPLPGAEERATVGLLLYSPFSNRTWGVEDQTLVEKLVTYIARRLNTILNPMLNEPATSVTETQMQEAQKYIQRAQEENKRLSTQLEQAQRLFTQEKGRAESLAALVARQEEASRQENLALKTSEVPSVPLAEFQALQDNLAQTQRQLSELEKQLLQAGKTAEQAQEYAARLAAERDAAQLAARQVALQGEEQAARLSSELDAARLAVQQAVQLAEQQTNQAVSTSVLPADQFAQPISSDHGNEIRMLAQEMRQPLASISGYTEMLLGETMGILGTLQRKFLERIRSSVERITTQIDDLSQVSTLAENAFHLSLETIDLNAVIDEAIIGAMSPLREKNLLLRVDIPDDLPEFRADQHALQQILTYLLQNAGQCTPNEGEVTLRARAELKSHEPGFMLIQISDTGCGISPEDLAHIFSPAHLGDEEKIPGIGVSAENLAAVKMLVEAHRGRIWVDSSPGQGATYSAVFPLASEELGVR